MVFEDNIRKRRIEGVHNYMYNITFTKILSHIRYSHVKLHILKITQHPEDGTVRVRWRVVGLKGWKVILTFWRFRLFKLRQEISPYNSDGLTE